MKLATAIAGSAVAIATGLVLADPVTIGVLGAAAVLGHVVALPELGRRRTVVPAIAVAATVFAVPLIDVTVALAGAIPL
ncbi:MAG: hypothetical protein GWO04_10445, partial [Actinobacteria bacterium]|nr:hypothetical protein [Actinomycetota bacterium]